MIDIDIIDEMTTDIHIIKATAEILGATDHRQVSSLAPVAFDIERKCEKMLELCQKLCRCNREDAKV